MYKRAFLIFVLVIIFIMQSVPVFSIDGTSSTTAMRMRPLVERLQGMSVSNIQAGINKYSDVNRHWAKSCIGKLTQIGVIGGGGKGRFNPDGEMSVAAFVKTVTLSLGYKIVQSVKPGTNWYDPFIAQAKKDKLLDNGDFKDYTKAITREQAAKILYRAAMLFSPDVKEKGHLNVMRCRLKDYALIGDKYKDFVVKSYVLGYLTLGQISVANPKGKLTRAQSCIIAMRLLDAKQRTVFTLKEGEYYLTNDGHKAFPQYNDFDNIGAINLLKNNTNLSKGYAHFGASFLGSGITYFEGEDEYKNNPIEGMDMCMEVHNDSSMNRKVNYVYQIVTFNTKACKDLHYDILLTLFKYLFQSDSDRAIKELNKVTNLCLNDSYKKADIGIKLNNRWLYIGKLENATTFQMWITCKGGLSDSEFIKKYGMGP